MELNLKNISKNEKIIVTIISLLVVITLFSVIVFFVKQPAIKEKKQVQKISFQISYHLFMKGYTVPVIVITNNSNTVWMDCEMKINNQYLTKIGIMYSSSSGENTKTILITEFLRPDGVEFNYYSAPPESACIVCLKPNYNNYCGEFKKVEK